MMLILSVLPLVVILSVPSVASETPAEHYRKGVLAWQKGDVDSAIEEWRRFVELRPDSLSARDKIIEALLFKIDLLEAAVTKLETEMQTREEKHMEESAADEVDLSRVRIIDIKMTGIPAPDTATPVAQQTAPAAAKPTQAAPLAPPSPTPSDKSAPEGLVVVSCSLETPRSTSTSSVGRITTMDQLRRQAATAGARTGLVVARGILANNSNKTYSRVRLFVSFYDARGVQVGSEITFVDVIGPGAQAEFTTTEERDRRSIARVDVLRIEARPE